MKTIIAAAAALSVVATATAQVVVDPIRFAGNWVIDPLQTELAVIQAPAGATAFWRICMDDIESSQRIAVIDSVIVIADAQLPINGKNQGTVLNPGGCVTGAATTSVRLLRSESQRQVSGDFQVRYVEP
ncbi:MAG: hypothetical protein AAFQ67_00530 [Pseudomonadota bacterium]